MGGLVARAHEGESRMTEATESEGMGPGALRGHARANRHSGPGRQGEAEIRPRVHDTTERAANRLTPGPSRRATFWAWACVSCGEIVMLWSRARPVKCVSGCDSYGWKVLLKQYPNESEDAFLARFARRDVTT